MDNLQFQQLRDARKKYISVKDWPKVKEISEQMIAIDPSASRYTKLAVIFLKMKDRNRALESLQKALHLNPNYLKAQKLYTDTQKDPNETLEDLREFEDDIEEVPTFSVQKDPNETLEDLREFEKDMKSAEAFSFEKDKHMIPKQNKQILSSNPDETLEDSRELEKDLETPAFSLEKDKHLILKRKKKISSSVPVESKMFAHYKIEKKLGQGGMGVVYKAFDTKLNRVVALKIVQSKKSLSEKEKARFITEGKATARLDHPHIVKIWEAMETPQLYFTMEYIKGENLHTIINKKKLLLKSCPALFSKIAFAVHAAHRQGIIHRDLKPSNIMITQQGEPKILDFGLAKITQSQEGVTVSSDVLGTPAYMSPEQAENKNVTHSSDIYSLGASLYEGITGVTPFQGAPINIICQVLHHEPVPPRQINPYISQELEAICLKCLEKNPMHRYQSAEQLAIDLRNFQEHKPIIAKPANTITQLRKFFLRNRLLANVLGIIIIIIVAAGIFSSIQLAKAEKASAKAEQRLDQANQAEKRALDAEEKALGAEKRALDAKKEAEEAVQKTIQAKLETEQAEEQARKANSEAFAAEQKALIASQKATATEAKMLQAEQLLIDSVKKVEEMEQKIKDAVHDYENVSRTAQEMKIELNKVMKEYNSLSRTLTTLQDDVQNKENQIKDIEDRANKAEKNAKNAEKNAKNTEEKNKILEQQKQELLAKQEDEKQKEEEQQLIQEVQRYVDKVKDKMEEASNATTAAMSTKSSDSIKSLALKARQAASKAKLDVSEMITKYKISYYISRNKRTELRVKRNDLLLPYLKQAEEYVKEAENHARRAEEYLKKQ